MTRNVGNRERISRALAGAAFVAFSIGGVFNPAMGAVLGVVGVVVLATAAVGFCPAYGLLRRSTVDKGKRGG